MGNAQSKSSDNRSIMESDHNRGVERTHTYYFNVVKSMAENYIQNYRIRTEIYEATDTIIALNNETHKIENWFNQRFDDAKRLQMQADHLLRQQVQMVKY